MKLNPGDGIFPLYQIVPNLYQRGKVHHFSDQAKLTSVQHYGIRDIVALAPPTPDAGLEFLNDLGVVRYYHIPIADGILRVQDELLELANELTKAIREGGGVLTMCNAGRNRSGLLSALIVRERLGVTGMQAMEIVRRERPNALANEYFSRFLVSLSSPDG